MKISSCESDFDFFCYSSKNNFYLNFCFMKKTYTWHVIIICVAKENLELNEILFHHRKTGNR